MWSLICQVGSLIRQPLRSQVSENPVESLQCKRTASSVLFFSAKIKIVVSLCAAGTQPMADTYYSVQRRYRFLPAPFEVADRRSCNGCHGRAAHQSLVWIPVTDLFQAETANTSLKLLVCCEEDCTICSVKYTDTDCRALCTRRAACWRARLSQPILSKRTVRIRVWILVVVARVHFFQKGVLNHLKKCGQQATL